jgi:triosephosphate isomerase
MKRKEWTNETPHFTSTKTRKKKRKRPNPIVCTQTQKRTPEKREKKTPR